MPLSTFNTLKVSGVQVFKKYCSEGVNQGIHLIAVFRIYLMVLPINVMTF